VVRACTRLTEAAKALATRDHVRGISGLSALSNNLARHRIKKKYGQFLYQNSALPSLAIEAI